MAFNPLFLEGSMIRIRRGLLKTLILIGFISLITFRGFAKDTSPQDQKESAIMKRWRFLRKEYPKTHPDIFKVIRTHYPNEIEAMAQLGDSELENKNWKKADYWYTICLFKDPDNLRANYGCAISRREMGVFHNPLQRNFDWKKAKKCFTRILAQDSTYKDFFL